MKEELESTGKEDLCALMTAEEIKKDKKRMKEVQKHASNKMATIQSIADLKTAYNAKYGEGRLLREKMKHEGAETKEKEALEEKKV